MPTQLRIEIHRSTGLTVLAAAGELDVSCAGELVVQARRLASLEEEGTLAIDLREVTFMDSTGLRALLSVEQTCREAGRAFSVIRGPRQVQRLMAVTRTLERLNVREADQLPGL